MEHLMSSLQDKNKITELTIKVSLLEEENLKLRNQIIENHITIGKMQNISNTGKDSQAKPVELNMTKLVNNGETLTLDNGSMSNNEPLSKKPICSKSIEEQMAEFRNKNHEKYLQYKRNSAKTHDKDESIQSPICISETDKNDNVTSDNSEDGPWPKGTICITGDSILSGLQPGLLSQKRKVKVKTFSGANVRDMHDNIKPILRHKPEYIILHIGTNDALNLPPNEILDKILELKKKIEEINKDCKVIISTPTYRFDNRKAGNTANELSNMLINLNVTIVNNKNISRKHLGYKGLHLNSYESSRLAMNLISVIKKL